MTPKEPLRPWLDPGLDSARIARQWAGIEAGLDRRARPRWTWGAALLGGALALTALGVGISHWSHAPESAAVAPPGGSVLVLADGSHVALDREAKLELPTNERTHVAASLKGGSARFDVVPAPDRVFTVIAGEVEVRVAGTQFQLDFDPTSGAVTVAVFGGAAEVRSAAQPGEVHRLGVGETWSTSQAAPLSPSAQPPAVASADPIAPAPPAPSAEPGPAPVRSAAAPAEDARALFESANQARRAGDLARASAQYRELLRRYPNDPRAKVAALELGRIEMDRDRDPAGAELALRTASGAATGTSVHEDALARLVQLYAAKGDARACQEARARYLTAYPNGVHGAQVRAACAPR